ncbi:hypothetical protein GCM10007863_16980 [Dyella mobilis]|nr:hypothetical protein GCM10007863_16980 [Dyella mobilis]
MLLVADEHGGHYKLTVLSPPQDVAYLGVISKWPPGIYSSVTDKKLDIRLDSIEYEAIEAGSLLFFYDNGSFHSEVVVQ